MCITPAVTVKEHFQLTDDDSYNNIAGVNGHVVGAIDWPFCLLNRYNPVEW